MSTRFCGPSSTSSSSWKTRPCSSGRRRPSRSSGGLGHAPGCPGGVGGGRFGDGAMETATCPGFSAPLRPRGPGYEPRGGQRIPNLSALPPPQKRGKSTGREGIRHVAPKPLSCRGSRTGSAPGAGWCWRARAGRCARPLLYLTGRSGSSRPGFGCSKLGSKRGWTPPTAGRRPSAGAKRCANARVRPGYGTRSTRALIPRCSAARSCLSCGPSPSAASPARSASPRGTLL
jgi:hypothetical protein